VAEAPPIALTPADLEGLEAATYASLARSFKEKGRQDLADQCTLLAVKQAKDGAEALKYVSQRYGPTADRSAGMNEYLRSDAPYVASPDVQLQAATLAAAKLTTYEQAQWALRDNPAQTKEANTVILERMVDLAGDQDLVTDVLPLVKALGTPEGIAYAEAARKAKTKTSVWTRLWRGLQQL
jgi:hypothetical protein